MDAAKRCGVGSQPLESLAQQRGGAADVSGLQVVEGRRGLNHALQEILLRLFEVQPNALPMLMGEPELLCSVTAETLSERAGIPVERHIPSIGDARTGVVRLKFVAYVEVLKCGSFDFVCRKKTRQTPLRMTDCRSG